jgi:hypothetical protein
MLSVSYVLSLCGIYPRRRGDLVLLIFSFFFFFDRNPQTQWLDYFCSFITSDLSWRVPLLMQSVIGAVLAIGTLFLPESPRWLIDTEQDEEGMGVLADLHGDGDPEDERVRWRSRSFSPPQTETAAGRGI